MTSKKTLMHILVVAGAMIAIAVIATPAGAVNHYWVGDASTNWQDVTNWSYVASSTLPGNQSTTLPTWQDYVEFSNYTATNMTVDLNGVNGYAAEMKFHYAKAYTFVDTVGSAKLVVNRLNLRELQGTITFNVEVDANQLYCDYAGYNDYTKNFTFNKPVDVAGATQLGGTWIFNTTLTAHSGVNLVYMRGSLVDANGPVVTPSITLGTSTIYNVMDPHALGDGSTAVTVAGSAKLDIKDVIATWPGSITVAAGGNLNIGVTQSSWPSGPITINAGAALSGDATGATYGVNVILAENAVLALTANEPVDTTTGVFDAKYFRGVTNKSNDVVTIGGDDGNSIYKGVAVGPWASGDMSGTIQAPSGVAELKVMLVGASTKFTSNSEMLMTDTDTTQTADIYVGPGANFLLDGGAINQTSAADAGLQITTFNIHGEGGGQTIFQPNNLGVKAGQTYNVTNGVCYTNTNGQGNYGTVVLKSGAGFSCGNVEAFKNPATAGQYVFEDGSVIQLGSTLQTALDKYGATVTTGDDDTGFFHIKGDTIACFDLNRDQTLIDGNMQKIIEASNISMSNNNSYRFKGYGLHLGDGKYLLLERNVDSTAAGTTFIGTDFGSATVGIAAKPGSNNYIAAPFDANSATLVIGSDTPMTFVNTGTNVWNDRVIAMATGTVQLTGGLVKTYQIDIKSGKLNLNYAQDLSSTDVLIESNGTLIAGKAVTLHKVSGNGTIQTGANLTFATVAPGAGVGKLTADTLVFASGSTYEWQVADADGETPGEDWDMISAGNITFAGGWTFKIPEANLAGSVEDTTFVVASVTGAFTGFDLDDVSFDLPAGWSGGSLALANNNKDLVLTGLSSSLAGDTDNNGVVDAADFITLKKNFGAGPGAAGMETIGDFDNTGTVNWNDLSTLMTNMGVSAGAPATTPEPATLGLLAIGALAVIRRRRAA